MRFEAFADTDVGIKKQVNQDSVLVKRMSTGIGPAALAVLCDGMGGLQYGEVASMSIVSAFSQWADQVLPELARQEIADHVIRDQWTDLLRLEHQRISDFASGQDARTGSTVVALLMTPRRYYAVNIGDSRLYRLDGAVTQLSRDHTVVAEEVRRGNMTAQQAQCAPMRGVLTQCVGVGAPPRPELFFGVPGRGQMFLLCSDGFYHQTTPEEMRGTLLPDGGETSAAVAAEGVRRLIELEKQRGETDNISAAVILTRQE